MESSPENTSVAAAPTDSLKEHFAVPSSILAHKSWMNAIAAWQEQRSHGPLPWLGKPDKTLDSRLTTLDEKLTSVAAATESIDSALDQILKMPQKSDIPAARLESLASAETQLATGYHNLEKALGEFSQAFVALSNLPKGLKEPLRKLGVEIVSVRRKTAELVLTEHPLGRIPSKLPARLKTLRESLFEPSPALVAMLAAVESKIASGKLRRASQNRPERLPSVLPILHEDEVMTHVQGSNVTRDPLHSDSRTPRRIPQPTVTAPRRAGSLRQSYDELHPSSGTQPNLPKNGLGH